MAKKKPKPVENPPDMTDEDEEILDDVWREIEEEDKEKEDKKN